MVWKTQSEWDKEADFIEEFLDLYKRLPALWDKTSKDYADRTVKNRQYNILIAKYKKMHSDAERVDVVRKINCLRTNYRKEHKKVQESLEKGEERVPTLWYYTWLEFLDDPEHDTTPPTNEELLAMEKEVGIGMENPDYDDSDSQDAEVPAKRKTEEHDTSFAQTDDEQEKEQANAINNRRSIQRLNLIERRKQQRRNINKLLVWQNSQRAQKPNVCQQIATVWGIELAKMTSTQQIYAKKAINEILYEGQLGNLHPNAVRITRPVNASKQTVDDPLVQYPESSI